MTFPSVFQMIEFGIGRRRAKAAALARFAASAGFGDAWDIYRFVAGLPRTMTGVIFAEGTPVPGLEAPVMPSPSSIISKMR